MIKVVIRRKLPSSKTISKPAQCGWKVSSWVQPPKLLDDASQLQDIPSIYYGRSDEADEDRQRRVTGSRLRTAACSGMALGPKERRNNIFLFSSISIHPSTCPFGSTRNVDPRGAVDCALLPGLSGLVSRWRAGRRGRGLGTDLGLCSTTWRTWTTTTNASLDTQVQHARG
jgi:hypothetical protein